jgi:probable HAF family extracellular repeat protein
MKFVDVLRGFARRASIAAELLARWASIAAVLVSTVALSHAATRGGGQATFQGLGFLDPNGFGPTIAYGISADGRVVVGQSVSPQGFEAFRWTSATGIVGLGAFPNPGGFPSSGARACSADGSVIVGSSSLPDSLNEDGSPFRWTAQTGLVFLGSLGGSSGGVARGVSSDGSVIAGYGSNSNFDPEAFRWTNTGIVGLGDLPGGVFNSQASAVSGDGSRVIGLASSGSVYNTSFKWTSATGLAQMQPADFRTIGMSRDGVFAAGNRAGRAARVHIDTGSFVIIPHLHIPGLDTDTDTAWAADSDGSVVVGMQNLSQGNGAFGRAFLWDAQHGTRILRDLLIDQFGLWDELAGWELNAGTCVSDDGRVIAGYGFAPSGEQAGWRATLPAVDPPGTLVCFGDGRGPACPCSNFGEPGRGCENSASTGGARLAADGTASLANDTLVLSADGELPTALSVFFQGRQEVPAAAFGDGLRCAGGALKRLYVKSAVAGVVTAPQAGDASVSARSAGLGDVILAGEMRLDQAYYRDPNPTFCPPPAGNTWNVSNAVRIAWAP